MARKAKKKNRTRKQLGQEPLEHRQLLTAMGLTPVAAPVEDVAIPAFVSLAADRDEVHSKGATGSKLDAVKGEGIFSCGSSFPVANGDLSADTDTFPVVQVDSITGPDPDPATFPVAGDAAKDPGMVTGQRDSVAIPAFAIADPGDAEGLAEGDRASFDAKAHREDWTIIGNPSLESTSSNIDTEYQELFDADSHRDGWTIIGNPSIRVDAGETGLGEKFQSILPDEDTFPLATTLKNQTSSAVVAGQEDTVPVGTMTNVDTSRYEEIADSQQDDLIAIIACVEADNIENPTDVGQDSFDAKAHREDWTIVGNPSLESTSSNHESHADGLAVAGQPEGWVLGGKPSLDGYEDTRVIGSLETVDPNASDAAPTPVTTTMDAVVNASLPLMPLATEAKLNKSSLPETDCTGGEIELDDSGKLTLYGTECHDVGQVNYYGANIELLEVHLNGQVWGLPSAAVNLVTFIGYDGDDFFRNLTSIISHQFGGRGADTLLGGSSNDKIGGGEGSDKILGGAGKDVLSGNDGHDTIRGGPGVDTIYGDGGHDWIYGDQGNDILYGGFAADELFGGTGADQIYGEHGDDTLRGQGGKDTLVGGDGGDNMLGGTETDILQGGNGHDILDGGDGNDVLRGGPDNDYLMGGAGADILRGGDGVDQLYGETGKDTLYGNAGDDNLYGQSGNDGLFGGGGNDCLEGGSGADRFLYSGNDTILDQADSDAAIHFVNGEKTWLGLEVIAVDAALKNLHDLTGNTALLEGADGGELTFVRLGLSSDTTLAYVDDETQTAYMYDQAFYSTDSDGNLDWTAFRDRMNLVVYHEIAHNWDDENDGWSDFLEFSDWTESDDGWEFDEDTEFARDYGNTSPMEDFATSFAFFVCSQTGEDYWDGDGETNAETQDRIEDKWDFMNDFVASL